MFEDISPHTGSCPLLFCCFLHTSSEMKMMNNENKKVLKGQHIIAQGKRRRSVALGLKANRKIVRAITAIKANFLFRTKEMISISRQMMPFNSVRKEILVLFITFFRTVFVVFPLPKALPWAELYWPFRPGKYFDLNLCIKSSLLGGVGGGSC